MQLYFNVHPGAKKVCAVCLQILHRTSWGTAGDANLIISKENLTWKQSIN